MGWPRAALPREFTLHRKCLVEADRHFTGEGGSCLRYLGKDSTSSGLILKAISRDPRMDRLIGRGNIAEQVITPESIDYSTDAVLIDSVPISDWTGSRALRPRIYYDMLYSSDGTVIEHMPIDSRNWQAELLAMFNDIKRCQREPKEPLKAWDSSSRRRQRTRLMPEGYEGMEGYEYEQRMREQQLY